MADQEDPQDNPTEEQNQDEAPTGEAANTEPQQDETVDQDETPAEQAVADAEAEEAQPEQDVAATDQDVAVTDQPEVTGADQEGAEAEPGEVQPDQEDVGKEQEVTGVDEGVVEAAAEETEQGEAQVGTDATAEDEAAAAGESEVPAGESKATADEPEREAAETVKAEEEADSTSKEAKVLTDRAVLEAEASILREEEKKTAEGDEVQVQTEVAATETEPTQEQPEVDPHAPSPDPNFERDATATVKFVLMPSGQVATLRCNLGQSLGELKQHFATELKIPSNFIVFMLNGKSLEDHLSVGEMGVGPNGTVQLEVQSSDPSQHPIKPIKPRQEYHMPDVITVRVQTIDGNVKDIVVEIERTTKRKPYQGGYRHKKSGVEFHHASAQTMQKQRPPSLVPRYCRDTQTVQQNHRPQQTTNDTSTQMTNAGFFVSNMKDKMLVPGRYTTADQHNAMILKNVIIIQKYYRRWLAKRLVDRVRADKIRRLEWERQEEMRKKKEKEERIRREFERRMNPKTKEDFDLLYHALEKWRLEEMERINKTYSGAERKAALCQLLEQETSLITSIGRHKIDADKENKEKGIQAFLENAASPKKWKGPDGNVTEMDTPYTLRAKQLQEIYNGINMKYLTQDERLDVLLTLKHTVKEHECRLTQEVIELIDREADLLMRGVKESNLDGLRKRISTLFLQYIKTPTFNPEASRLIKVPQDPSSLRKNIHFCNGCNQYLPSTDFQMSTNTRSVGHCHTCRKMENESRLRQDHTHYRLMLTGLRETEEAYSDGSKIAFLLQENDLRYLVENVWNSQSALSAWDDLYDLVLVRWDHHEEWSPWNCVLLTKEEASAHEKLVDLEEAYGKTFVHKVQHKHTLAHNYFSRLPKMAEHVKQLAKKEQHRSPGGTKQTTLIGKGLTMQPAKA